MRLICPACARPSLTIGASIELAPDASSDEITVQVMGCTNCGVAAIGVYEESRRGSIDSDAWSHTSYVLDAGAVRQVAAHIAACPEPVSGSCACVTHRLFGARDRHGAWLRLTNAGFALTSGSPTKLATG